MFRLDELPVDLDDLVVNEAGKVQEISLTDFDILGNFLKFVMDFDEGQVCLRERLLSFLLELG